MTYPVSTTAVAPTPTTSSFGLNETTWGELKSDVKKGPCKRLQLLVRLFGQPEEHHFLKEKPALATKLAVMCIRQWKKGQLDKPTLQKAIDQFKKHEVFTREKLIEKVSIPCQDGTVRINKELLVFQSDYFKTMFTSPMKIGTAEDRHKVQLPSINENYHTAAVEIFKNYIYSGKLPELGTSRDVTAIQTVVEILQIAHVEELKDLITFYTKELKKILPACVITTEKELDLVLKLLDQLAPLELVVELLAKPEPISTTITSLSLTAIGLYIGQPIKTLEVPSDSSSNLLISIDQLPFLDVSQQLVPRPVDPVDPVDPVNPPPLEPSPSEQVVQKALLKLIGGIYISTKAELDLVGLLPFYPEELFKNITDISFKDKSEFEPDQMASAQEAIRLVLGL